MLFRFAIAGILLAIVAVGDSPARAQCTYPANCFAPQPGYGAPSPGLSFQELERQRQVDQQLRQQQQQIDALRRQQQEADRQRWMERAYQQPCITQGTRC